MDKIEQIGILLLEAVAERFNKEPLEVEGLEFGDTFAELLEKFIILHIRTWKLEDAVGDAKHIREIADLKLKIDYCFKNMRPKLIRAINCFLDVYIDKNHARPFAEVNVKLYTGHK